MRIAGSAGEGAPLTRTALARRLDLSLRERWRAAAWPRSAIPSTSARHAGGQRPIREPPPLAHRAFGDARAWLAARPDEPRADRAHHRRRDPHGLAWPGGARRGRARHQSLFRLPDLRHRGCERDRAAPRPGACARRRVRTLRADAAMGVPAGALGGGAALFPLGLAAAGLDPRDLDVGAAAQSRDRLGADVREARLRAARLAGAGVATTVSSLFMFIGLALVTMLDRRLRRYRLFGRWWRPDAHRLRTIWRIGLPIGGTLLFEVGLFNAAAFVMGLFGAEALAAHAIALQIATLSFMVPLGLAQAGTVRVGLARGASDPGGVGSAGWTAFALGVGFMAGIAILMVAFPRALVGVFLDAGDPANAGVIGLAVTFLGFAALFQVVDGAQAVGAGILRGLNDTRVPMLYAALGYWGIGATLGIALAFPAGLKGAGIWIGLATGLAVVAVLMLRRWLRRDDLGLLGETSTVGIGRVETAPGPA